MNIFGNEDHPLATEHYCGEFPGAGGHMLRNKVWIYLVDWVPDDCPEGWYWWNPKEGNGVIKGGPFKSAWDCYAGALLVYPEMAKGDHHHVWVSLTPKVEPITYAPRRGLRRTVR